MPRSNRGRLLKLWTADPRCHWCSRETLIHLGTPGSRKTAATIDHIITKRMGQGHRGKPVLACNGCNMQRCKDEQAMLSKKRRLSYRQRILRLIAQGGAA
jgi:hypothetical protein